MLAAIANEVGAEAAEAARRSMELRRNLRPLTDAARSQLHDNLAPVLNDISATGAIVPQIREEEHKDLGQDMVSAWLQGLGMGNGLSLTTMGCRPALRRRAGRLVLKSMGLSLDDLTAAPRDRAAVPTFAAYVPVVSGAVSDGTRRAYGTYWNRVVDRWGAGAWTSRRRRTSGSS